MEKKYFAQQRDGGVYTVKIENGEVTGANRIDSSSPFDYTWFIEEDGILVITQNDGTTIEKSVKAGNILAKLYSKNGNYSDKVFHVIEDKFLAEYYTEMLNFRRERDRQDDLKSCDCCDSCTPSASN